MSKADTDTIQELVELGDVMHDLLVDCLDGKLTQDAGYPTTGNITTPPTTRESTNTVIADYEVATRDLTHHGVPRWHDRHDQRSRHGIIDRKESV